MFLSSVSTGKTSDPGKGVGDGMRVAVEVDSGVSVGAAVDAGINTGAALPPHPGIDNENMVMTKRNV